MKRRFLSIALVLLLTAALSLTAFADGNWKDNEPTLDHVTDEVGIISREEKLQLEAMAAEVSAKYDLGVYIIAVWDHGDYAYGDVFDVAKAMYKGCSLGLGEGKDGVLLLLSLYNRDYSLITYGDRGNYAFTEAGREHLVDFFLDDFADENYYNGFVDYINGCDDYLAAAAAGEPYDKENLPRDPGSVIIAVLAILLIPLLAAALVTAVLNGKMKSVAIAERATAYVEGRLELFGRHDQYTHTTTVRRKIESSSGSKSSRSSGGFSGTSGKF